MAANQGAGLHLQHLTRCASTHYLQHVLLVQHMNQEAMPPIPYSLTSACRIKIMELHLLSCRPEHTTKRGSQYACTPDLKCTNQSPGARQNLTEDTLAASQYTVHSTQRHVHCRVSDIHPHACSASGSAPNIFYLFIEQADTVLQSARHQVKQSRYKACDLWPEKQATHCWITWPLTPYGSISFLVSCFPRARLFE